ncbi:MAG: alpha-ketoglutarate-dependent dioxygenase AlkB [Gammaproteobacteria bacterium]|nr:alpha-ketoglutarate-dependent dioxygenase AlkB [Gammaproteobacteria bacterium]CAJ2375906.1 MAG: Alpha-ketoglutarate-dependent dioxygenase AlkB [Arenicellales bacterium IbO2]MDA7961799.1 alpha-ketoglutarate-dependent dioxygenase AlkB [Gammaproteobacteria bacterium]MDA7969977.1 alpha-ketoglutarate-dependent dioxygenase AlkB [Gammaproteobacteria bacterium]MDA7972814.1 alpha-ketoglutarate-dependent dioxygenase AlkB [Gammaproteobacteria bacterium]
MTPQTQTELPSIAEQSPLWDTALAPLPEQTTRLRDGGGVYRAQYITPSEEAELLAAADAAPWRHDLRRRVQHYGYRYDYAARGLHTAHAAGHAVAEPPQRIGGLPDWVRDLGERLVRDRIFAALPEQLIVNEYEPGQGIAPHTDRDCFGPVVVSLSLGGDCMMRILPHPGNSDDAFDLILQRRSLLVLRGPSRDRWRHGIAARRSDSQHGRRIPRRRRVSLTFRTIISP